MPRTPVLRAGFDLHVFSIAMVTANFSLPRGLGFSQIQLDTICRPSRNAAAEEVLVLRPNRQVEQQSYCHHRPIVRITGLHTFAGRLFLEAAIHRLYDPPDFLQSRHAGRRVEPATLGYFGDVLEGILKAHVRAVETSGALVKF